MALSALKKAEIPFMLGGAFSVYHYTGWWRNTHDIDAYVTKEDLPKAVEALERAGFHDLGEQAAGDRDWIYHAGMGDIIVDLIFRFANLPNYITPDWFDRASRGQFLGMDVCFLPLEEQMWVKTFVINRHRCDWPDIMRIIKAQCERLDWDRLLELLGEHWMLLAGLIDVFDWQHPDSINCIPMSIRDELLRRRQDYWANPPEVKIPRDKLLDPWLYQRADRYAIRSNEQPDD